MIACLPILLAAAGLAAAQTPLTMEASVEMALRRHPAAAAARAAADVAGTQIRAATALPQPEIRYSANYLDFDPDTLEARANLGFRWSPPHPFEQNWKRRIAEERLRGAEAGARGVDARLAADVRHAFRRAAIARQRAAVAELEVEARLAILDVVRRQVAEGLKEAAAATLAELEWAEARLESQRMASLADNEFRRLVRLVDDTAEPAAFTLADDPGLLSVPRPPVAGVTSSRAEAEQLAGRCREYQWEAAVARVRRYPWISFVQVSRRTSGLPTGRGPWGVQFGVELPVFRTPAAASAAVARQAGHRCDLELKALAASIAREIAETRQNLEAAARDLAEMDRLLMALAESAEKQAEAALTHGRADRADVLGARVRLLGLRGRWLARRLDYAALEARYESALGAVTP